MSASYPFAAALVTGASSGIGEVMAIELARAGVRTTVVARRQERLDELASRWPNIEVLVADLTTAGGCEAVSERIAATDEDRRIELVVNNAGFGTSGKFVNLDPGRLASEIELNVAALTRLTHTAAATMVPRRTGWILNVSSVAGFQPAPGLAVYAATKAYVTSLTESLHEELRPSGVHVTALCPGLTKTEFQRVSNTESYADRFPAAAWTSPQMVVSAGLRGVVKNRAIVVPGRQYRMLATISAMTPRSARRRATSLLQRQR